jgi:hypothetical protein
VHNHVIRCRDLLGAGAERDSRAGREHQNCPQYARKTSGTAFKHGRNYNVSGAELIREQLTDRV